MIAALILGLVSSASALASGPIDLSPVHITDPVAYSESLRKFSERRDTRAFRDAVQILYDRFIDRPWGDAYWPQADQDWKNLLSALCPGLPTLCSLSTGLSNEDQLHTI